MKTNYCVADDHITEAVNGAKWTFGKFGKSTLQEGDVAYVA
jgi:hypothetical protein